MRIVTVSMALAAVAIASPLFAPAAMADPVLNGKYNFSYVETCQATITPTPNGSNFSKLVGTDDGTLSGTQTLAVFDSAKGTFSLKGSQDSGDLLMISGASGNKVIKDEPFALSLTFKVAGYAPTSLNSGTATFTFTPTTAPKTKVILNAVIGFTTAAPTVIAYMEFLGIDAAGCYGHGTAILHTQQ